MAESTSPPTGGVAKELVLTTTQVPSSNGAAAGPLPDTLQKEEGKEEKEEEEKEKKKKKKKKEEEEEKKKKKKEEEEEKKKEEEATPKPPNSSSLSTENWTITAVTTEEESLSALLGHVETVGAEPGLDQDRDQDQDQEESSTDSVSFSMPSPELSAGAEATGKSLDVEDGLGGGGCSPSTEDPGLKDQDPPEAAGGAVAPPTPGGSASLGAGPSTPAYYLVKWITWKEKKTPIVTQSENGPCPLLAIMNTLFLRWKAKLPAQTEVVTTEDLMAHLGESEPPANQRPALC
ncbi:Protein FAM63A [Liparis tanakae]|uniref:Ubiquitin carboxyl-terminal hydrolase n=1 Tax=Liparis tanakae TaxID=230148 RepID=A0A4Z2FF58_9TELE|nr:Protein FAM63A [Liparis tanakae]